MVVGWWRLGGLLHALVGAASVGRAVAQRAARSASYYDALHTKAEKMQEACNELSLEWEEALQFGATRAGERLRAHIQALRQMEERMADGQGQLEAEEATLTFMHSRNVLHQDVKPVMMWALC